MRRNRASTINDAIKAVEDAIEPSNVTETPTIAFSYVWGLVQRPPGFDAFCSVAPASKTTLRFCVLPRTIFHSKAGDEIQSKVPVVFFNGRGKTRVVVEFNMCLLMLFDVEVCDNHNLRLTYVRLAWFP